MKRMLSIALLLAAVLVAGFAEGSAIVYFSATGNTERVAGMLAEMTGSDLFRIEPEVPYTDADLNYGDRESRTSIESRDPDARPEIQPLAFDASAYDTLFLGFPIWFGDMPKAIYTFLDAYDLSGKTIAPFCTSGSSGITRAVRNIREMESGANVLDGRRINTGSRTAGDLQSWLDDIGL